MSLKQQVIGGIKWTTASSVITVILQLIQLGILARLLEPSDFGLMAIASVVIGFSQLFIDMGVSNVIIFKQKVSDKELSSLYWLSIIIGVVLFILVFLLSPLIANFYENAKLKPIIQIVAITFFIKPWGQQLMVILQKNMRFNDIAITDVFSRIISFISVILLAYHGYGVFSLVYGTLVYALVSTIGYNYFGRTLYQPQYHFKLSEVKEFLNFGLYQMGDKTINYFASEMDTILIGKLLGTEALGIYKVAKDLTIKPYSVINPIITKVTFPLMSKMNNDIKRLKSLFIKTLGYLSNVNFPVYILLFILAKPIVLILFGDEWIKAIPIVQILSITFALRSIGNPSGVLLLSLGKVNVAFYWGLAKFTLFPLAILLGVPWGMQGVAIAILILHILFYFLNWRFIIKKTIKISFKEYTKIFQLPFILILIPSLLGYLISYIDLPPYFYIPLSVFVFGLSYLGLNIKFNSHQVNELKNAIFNISK
jgi:O-antigen/teichoic acid export membrane protein